MFRCSFVLCVSGLVLSLASASEQVDKVTASADPSGTWTGIAVAKQYRDPQSLGTGEKEVSVLKVPVTVQLTQSGAALTASLTVQPPEGGAFTIPMQGAAGNGSFWLFGSGPNSDTTPTIQYIALTGHLTGNNKKALGFGLVWQDSKSENIELVYSLTRAVAMVSKAAAPVFDEYAGARGNGSGSGTIQGTAKGKSFPFKAGQKAQTYSVTISGVGGDTGVTLTLTGTGGSTTYTGQVNTGNMSSGSDTGSDSSSGSGSNKYQVFTGTSADGASTLIISVHQSKSKKINSASGPAYIFRSDGVIEATFKVTSSN